MSRELKIMKSMTDLKNTQLQQNCMFNIGDIVNFWAEERLIRDPCTIVEVISGVTCRYKLETENGVIINRLFTNEELKLVENTQ